MTAAASRGRSRTLTVDHGLEGVVSGATHTLYLSNSISGGRR